MFAYYGFFGLLVSILVLFLNFLGLSPYSDSGILFSNFFWSLGLLLFFDSLDYKLRADSFLHEIARRKEIVLYIIFIGLGIGTLIELSGAHIFGLWGDLFYSELSKEPGIIALFQYVAGITTAYGLSLLLGYSSCRVVISILKREFGEGLDFSPIPKRREKYILSHVGILGAIIAVSSFFIFLVVEKTELTRTLLFGLFLLGTWLLLEYIEFRENKTGLLSDILELRFEYPAAVFVASIGIGLLVELLNRLIPAWEYKNIPLSSVSLFGIPIVMLFGWVPLILILLSFYRTFFSSEVEIFDLE